MSTRQSRVFNEPNLDNEVYGSSATNYEGQELDHREFRRAVLHRAVFKMWPSLSILERLTYCLRFEVKPHWTLDEIGEAAGVSKQAVHGAQYRITESLREHIVDKTPNT